jgi:hypothetical protein
MQVLPCREPLLKENLKMCAESGIDKTAEKNVDLWFSKNEEALLKEAREKLKKAKEEAMRREQDVEKEKLKKLHWMKCPKCGHDMGEIVIEEVEVDKCGNCEGLYFDAGEFNEILLKKAPERKSFFRKVGLSK